MGKPLIYLAHPVRGDTAANVANAKAWLRFLFHRDPSRVYIAPWIAEVETFAEVGMEDDVATVTKALEDDEVVVAHCDGIILVGGRISKGMAIEAARAIVTGIPVINWTHFTTPADVPEGESPWESP